MHILRTHFRQLKIAKTNPSKHQFWLHSFAAKLSQSSIPRPYKFANMPQLFPRHCAFPHPNYSQTFAEFPEIFQISDNWQSKSEQWRQQRAEKQSQKKLRTYSMSSLVSLATSCIRCRVNEKPFSARVSNDSNLSTNDRQTITVPHAADCKIW